MAKGAFIPCLSPGLEDPIAQNAAVQEKCDVQIVREKEKFSISTRTILVFPLEYAFNISHC
jgi:hypothetical protein